MKVKVLHEISSEWLPGGAAKAGDVVEVAETQHDGSPLLYHPDYFEAVVEDKKAAKSAVKGE